MPPLPSTPVWTPDVIATVVYRAIMVIVSLAFIWRAYRQPSREVDGKYPTSYLHLAFSELIRQMSMSSAFFFQDVGPRMLQRQRLPL